MSKLTLPELCTRFKGQDKGFDVKRIVIEDSDLEEVESLEPFRSLEHLSFRDNKLSSIEFLLHNYYLKHINLSKNRLFNIDNIHLLTRLQYINISYNNLDDISPLATCTGLKVIIANNNKIVKFPKINNLKSLETLVLSDNLINTIDSPSAHNSKLIKLSLSRNTLRVPHLMFMQDFPSTSYWPNLVELRLNGNKIITLPTKEQLVLISRVRILDIGNNSIYEKKYIERLAELVNLKDLNIFGNPVNSQIRHENLNLKKLIIFNSKKIKKIKNEDN